MGATTTEGTGLGVAGEKALPTSNVSNVLFANSTKDGMTLDANINIVFLTFDNNYTLNLQPASNMTGKTVYFRSRGTGHTVTINNIYGNPYNFSSSYVHFVVISDGHEWQIMSWYSDD